LRLKPGLTGLEGFSGWKLSTYPGFLRGSLFLLLFVIVPIAARCQVSHVDSLLAESLGEMRPSIASTPFIWNGDSSLQPLLRVMPVTEGTSVPVFSIENLSATVRGEGSASARMFVNIQGALVRPGDPVAQPRSISRTFNITLLARDRMLLETNQDRYVSLEQPAQPSFWSSTLEPVLVVIGAAVIVALFFLIRS
ncbi:MAG: hypothetical protein ACHQNE_08110, partial [Candidatus Kapaibacterium sp.]